MLKKRIVPCLDVKDGRVVKGVKFEDLKSVGSPPELAIEYERQGGDEMVFLDISASIEGRKATLDVVKKTAENLFIPLTVGGGIASIKDIEAALSAGADKVSMNTAAVRNPSIITEAAELFGSQCVVVAIDAKRSGRSWDVYTHGGTRKTDLDAVTWAKRASQLGAGEILLTSMDRDGTTEGYDLELTRRIVDSIPIPVIASGGAGTKEHLLEALTEGKADAALAASIFHYGTYTVREVKEFIEANGVPMRP